MEKVERFLKPGNFRSITSFLFAGFLLLIPIEGVAQQSDLTPEEKAALIKKLWSTPSVRPLGTRSPGLADELWQRFASRHPRNRFLPPKYRADYTPEDEKEESKEKAALFLEARKALMNLPLENEEIEKRIKLGQALRFVTVRQLQNYYQELFHFYKDAQVLVDFCFDSMDRAEKELEALQSRASQIKDRLEFYGKVLEMLQDPEKHREIPIVLDRN